MPLISLFRDFSVRLFYLNFPFFSSFFPYFPFCHPFPFIFFTFLLFLSFSVGCCRLTFFPFLPLYFWHGAEKRFKSLQHEQHPANYCNFMLLGYDLPLAAAASNWTCTLFVDSSFWIGILRDSDSKPKIYSAAFSSKDVILIIVMRTVARRHFLTGLRHVASHRLWKRSRKSSF